MKKTIKAIETPAAFDPAALYSKAQLYIQQMGNFTNQDSLHALWSSLALELLARAALANVSPALLAETEKQWATLYFALGFSPTEPKFTPKSIAVSEVFKRLTAILPDFAQEHEIFGIQHTGRRNAELHSGELAFEGIKSSAWQPKYYAVSELLLKSMGKELTDLFGEDEAKAAQQLIAAAADETAKAVKGDLAAHQKVWNGKSSEERSILSKKAEVWATKQDGHRVSCPACKSEALVFGEPVSPPVKKIEDDEIIETQVYLPNKFECIACELKISGLSRLNNAELGDTYKKTSQYYIADLYAPDDEYYDYEPDNNEP